MAPFKSRLQYFHPVHYIPAINWYQDVNMSSVKSYTFSTCQSMQNIQVISNSKGCNTYCVKYVGKIDEQNFVIVYADGNKNEVLITEKKFFYTILSYQHQNITKTKHKKVKKKEGLQMTRH